MAWKAIEKQTAQQVAVLLTSLPSPEAGRAKVVPHMGLHRLLYTVFYQEVEK